MSHSPQEIMKEQITVVKKITQDECWYEGQRRGCKVSEKDRIVQHNVGAVIMINGSQMSKDAEKRLTERDRHAKEITMEV